MADDLDDEWWMGGDGVNEETSEVNDISGDSHGHGHDKLREKPVAANKEKQQQGKKRKKTAEQSQQKDGNKEKVKKKKKKKTLSEHLASTEQRPGTSDDLRVSMATHFHDELSVIEMEELILDEECFVDSNRGEESPSDFLSRNVPDWSELVKGKTGNGSCLILLLTSSAKRAVDLNRDAALFKGTCVTAKLFAKHLKMKEQEKFLSSHNIHFAVGTPHRVSNLLESGAFTLTDTKYVILDWNWRDAKLRKFVDIPELKKDLFDLLRKHVMPAANKAQLKLGLL